LLSFLHSAANESLSSRVDTPAFLCVITLLSLESAVAVTVGEPLALIDDEREGAHLRFLLAGGLASAGLSPADHQIITIDLGLQFVHRLATVSLVISLQHEWSTHQTLVTRGVIGHSQQDDVVLARLVLYPSTHVCTATESSVLDDTPLTVEDLLFDPVTYVWGTHDGGGRGHGYTGQDDTKHDGGGAGNVKL